MKKSIIFATLALISGLLFIAPDVLAAQPTEWQLGLQDAASPSAERIASFHNMLLYIIAGITLFVLVLLVYVCVRFNAKANPVPSKTTHHVGLEVLWTIVPVIILIIIAVPSFKLLYYVDRVAEPEMTLKVTGYQWYWGYEYPDHDGMSFSSYMIEDADIDPKKGQVRLLSTDNPVVLPIDTDIQVLVTAGDVLHAWAMPAFGVKTDSVPGRLNETWMNISKPGVYYGQCSEICGVKHAYMPIEIHALPKGDYETWVARAKVEFAENGSVDTGTLLAELKAENAIMDVATSADKTSSDKTN